jgi:hypothetical protein
VFRDNVSAILSKNKKQKDDTRTKDNDQDKKVYFSEFPLRVPAFESATESPSAHRRAPDNLPKCAPWFSAARAAAR